MRRTTDINRTIKQRYFAPIAALAIAGVMSWSATPCFGQAGDAGLPPGFRPPPQIPKEFGIEKPLVKEDEVTAWKRKRPEFQNALSGKLAGNAPKVIDEGFRVNVLALSLTERRDQLTNDRKAIVRYVDQFVPDKNVDMKKFACKAIIKHATSLLDGNFHVRLQAAILIGELNLSPEVPLGVKTKPAVACIDGLPTLLDVIQTPEGGVDQPEPVRILATLGAGRLLKEGRHTLKINSKMPADAARRFLTQLEGNGSDWYHQRLIEAIIQTGLANVPNAQNQQEPVIVEALARILADPGRSLRLRSRAVYLLGRTPMPAGIQAAPIAYATVKLTKQVADELNQRRIKPNQALFYLNDIFLAFKGRPGETTTDGRKAAGLMSTLNQPTTKSAYEDALPVVQTIFRQFQQAGNNGLAQATINTSFVEKLNGWMQPDDMALGAGRPKITDKMRKPAAATEKAAPPQAKRGGNPANPAS